ncbi:uncharacterized protein RAG0_13723 [Rhynchosporium agropyri]|uniref:Uncharacterized protein n=1 Tax=Rhynchosporium agropyri TaxID=914238 RepID=A0A1E1LDU4_9HELO|nr:uncharacterized protein RAG0_13723 [Rhynchosporium agropyri]
MATKASEAVENTTLVASTTNIAEDLTKILLATGDKLKETIEGKDKSMSSLDVAYGAKTKARTEKFEQGKALAIANLRDIESVSSEDDDSEDDSAITAITDVLEKEYNKGLERSKARNEKRFGDVQQLHNEEVLEITKKTILALSKTVASYEESGVTEDNIAIPEVDHTNEAEFQVFRQKVVALELDLNAKVVENIELMRQVKQLGGMKEDLTVKTVQKSDLEKGQEKQPSELKGSLKSDSVEISRLKEQVSSLERKIQLQEPLLQVGIAVRRGFIAVSKRVFIDGDLEMIWTYGDKASDKIKELNHAKNEASHRGNFPADVELLRRGLISRADFTHVYKKAALFAIASPDNFAVLNMFGTLTSCYVGTPYSVSKQNDDDFQKITDRYLALWKQKSAEPVSSAYPNKQTEFWNLAEIKLLAVNLQRVCDIAVAYEIQMSHGEGHRRKRKDPIVPSPVKKFVSSG